MSPSPTRETTAEEGKERVKIAPLESMSREMTRKREEEENEKNKRKEVCARKLLGF
jgi:hypothetical protein